MRKTTSHAGILPKRWGLVEISPSNLVLTTLKPGPGESAVLRVYEAAGQTTKDAKITFHAGIRTAQEANLLEDSAAKLSIKNDSVQFELHPFEIKTLKLELKPLGKKELKPSER